MEQSALAGLADVSMIMTVQTWDLCATKEDALGESDGNMGLVEKLDQVDPLLVQADRAILSETVNFNVLIIIYHHF